MSSTEADSLAHLLLYPLRLFFLHAHTPCVNTTNDWICFNFWNLYIGRWILFLFAQTLTGKVWDVSVSILPDRDNNCISPKQQKFSQMQCFQCKKKSSSVEFYKFTALIKSVTRYRSLRNASCITYSCHR